MRNDTTQEQNSSRVPGSILSAVAAEEVVLVADDDPVSRVMLAQILEESGYQVISVDNGDDARNVLMGESPPDIALLDWMMPGCSGPELCTLIREQVKRFVYTVLITARTDTADVILGLESGAHEFLTKPINLGEFNLRMVVASRILTYERRLSEQNREIQRYAARMKELAKTREGQLIHAERLSILGMLSAGISHEIRNPVAYVSGNAQVLGRYRADYEAAVRYALEGGVGDGNRLRFLLENGEYLINGIEEGIGRIVDILEGLSRFSRKGGRGRSDTWLAQCIDDAVELSRNNWKYHVQLSRDVADLSSISANGQEIIQVLVNLLVNAADAMKNRSDGKDSTLQVRLSHIDGFQRIEVLDNGPGIPEEIRQKIWDPFFTTRPEGETTGLGLAICSGIVEEHGGHIYQENRPEGGSVFIVELPTSASQTEP